MHPQAPVEVPQETDATTSSMGGVGALIAEMSGAQVTMSQTVALLSQRLSQICHRVEESEKMTARLVDLVERLNDELHDMSREVAWNDVVASEAEALHDRLDEVVDTIALLHPDRVRREWRGGSSGSADRIGRG